MKLLEVWYVIVINSIFYLQVFLFGVVYKCKAGLLIYLYRLNIFSATDLRKRLNNFW